MTITRSTIFGNTAGSGGGIENIEGNVTIINSTISGNTAENIGSGIVNSQGTVNINNSTITMNIASNGVVSGFDNFRGSTVNVSNTIIAQNTSSDCRGTFVSQGFNLIGNNQGCTGFERESDQVGTPAQPINAPLGPLQDNGGLTETHALLSGSRAIDTGNPAVPGGGNTCESVDQPGFRRPIDGDRNRTATCDIGAFEFGPKIVNNLFSRPVITNRRTEPLLLLISLAVRLISSGSLSSMRGL